MGTVKKYEAMVSANRKRNQQKEEVARNAILQLQAEGCRITVAALEKRTGLSRTFFYHNEAIRECLKKARQEKIPYTRDTAVAFDRAMSRHICLLEKENAVLKKELQEWKRAYAALKKQQDQMVLVQLKEMH